MSVFRNLTVRGKLISLLAFFGICLLAFGVMSFRTLDQVKVHGPLYAEIAQAKDLLADILPPPEYLVESYLLAFQMAEAADPTELEALIERGKRLRTEFETRHEYWAEHLPEGPDRKSVV